ncbi:hypothetical protein [Polaromonas sp.]|uniref:hypothetical protein n=1 Tax=Polaromonas sp. TaxID=1869339 RepID=UPI00286D3DA3|nr:hypothetical protein [Polaromonas sp.]
MRIFALLLLAPCCAIAQSAFPTAFPDGATPMTAEALKQRITGKVFTIIPAAGAQMRVQYQDTYAFVNSGSFSDSGKWRVEGSSVCIDWQKIPGGCSEMRTVGDAIYTKRASNGEVVIMQPK